MTGPCLCCLWIFHSSFCFYIWYVIKKKSFQEFNITMLQYCYRRHFYKRDHGDVCNTTVCVITQPLIIKNALNTVALLRASGYFISIFSGNKSNYLYYFNINICHWYFPIKDASFRFGERRLETVGGKWDTTASIYCIHSRRQDGKFLIGKAALDEKIEEKQKSKTWESGKVFLSASNMIQDLAASSMKYLVF